MLGATVCWQAASAKASAKASLYECKISYTGISVILHYFPDGRLVQEPQIERETDPLAKQLTAVLIEQAKDLEHNCSQVNTIAENGQLVFGYSCDTVRIDEGIESHVTPEYWYWSKDLGDGYRISLNPGGEVNGALLPGFSQRLPLMWVEGPKGGTDRNFARNGVWQWRVAVEVRVGNNAYREWSSSNVLGSLEWSTWPKLMSETGDITLTVYDTEFGVLKRSILPRNIFGQIETRIREDLVSLRAAQADPVGKCRLSKDWEGGPAIVVT